MLIICKNHLCPYNEYGSFCGSQIAAIDFEGKCNIFWKGKILRDLKPYWNMLDFIKKNLNIIDVEEDELKPIEEDRKERSSEISDALDQGLPHEQRTKKENDEEEKLQGDNQKAS